MQPEDPFSAPVVPILAVLILLRGLLYLFKTAFTRSRRARLRARAEAGDPRCARLLEAAKTPDRWLISTRIAMLFLEILAGAVTALGCAPPLTRLLAAAGLAAPLAAVLAVLLPALALGALFFLAAQALPRVLGRAFPETIAAALLPYAGVLPLLTAPLLRAERLLESPLKKLLLKNAGAPGTRGPGMTEDELRIALLEGEQSGIVESEERLMVEGVFHLGDRPVGAFMIHRSELRWLDIDAGAEEARQAAWETAAESASRPGVLRHFPVAAGNLDDVVGAVSVEDILKSLLNGPWPGLKALMTPPHFIPETMSALKAFEAFKQAETDYLFVMDEYGGFAGLLTVRNLIDEIVGQLLASGDAGPELRPEEGGGWLADGSVSIDEAAAVLGLPDLAGRENNHPEYHTLAGFILDLAGEIPRPGASFVYAGYRFTVAAMDGNRIDKIRIAAPL